MKDTKLKVCLAAVGIDRSGRSGEEAQGAQSRPRLQRTECPQIVKKKIIARVRNCPDITILCALSMLVFLSFNLFVLFVFLSRHHSDQMSEGSQGSKVTLFVEIQKWHSVTY